MRWQVRFNSIKKILMALFRVARYPKNFDTDQLSSQFVVHKLILLFTERGLSVYPTFKKNIVVSVRVTRDEK